MFSAFHVKMKKMFLKFWKTSNFKNFKTSSVDEKFENIEIKMCQGSGFMS